MTTSLEREHVNPRRLWRRVFSTLLLLTGAIALAGCGPELGPVYKLLHLPGPQLPQTSDPSALSTGGSFYVYGSDNQFRAPVTRLSDIFRSYSEPEKNALTTEAMPTQPGWTARARQIWAPTVAPVGGRWLMFFSADRPNPPQPANPQCIGRAWSNSPTGPFVPEGWAASCGIDGVGGALDPQLFYDPTTGQHWLLAAFGNTEGPLQAMTVDAAGNLGPATTILGRQFPWEYHFIENPAMAYDPVRGNYILTYSAGKWFEARYSTGIARCSSPAGPCTSDPSGPWIAASDGRTGPGGLSFFSDGAGTMFGIFSTFPQGGETTNGNRSASILPLTLDPGVALGPIVK